MPDTEHVWGQFHANLRRYVGRRLRNATDADDLVQRVFLRVHEALPRLRDDERIHAWVYQTTRYAIADHYRAPVSRREASPDDQDALRIVELEGVTQVEAARRVGLSVSGMKSRVQRARQRLKTLIEDCCRVERDRRGGIVSLEARRQARCEGCQIPDSEK
jgi:RNA polymerase sigma-70 factor, ECF subfamily